MKKIIASISCLMLLIGCGPKENRIRYYIAQPKTSSVDVFYLVSTNVLGNPDQQYATLDSTESEAMLREMKSVSRILQADSDNAGIRVIAPYYHQHTMYMLHYSADSIYRIMRPVEEEVCAAFDDYYYRLGNRRPFVLMGFSQGGTMVLSLLRHLNAEQYRHCVGAYVMGYRISANDTVCPYIRPAMDSITSGVTISYNTVCDTTFMWPWVSDSACTCINPLNWRTDTQPAKLAIQGDTSALYVDMNHRILLAPHLPAERYYSPAYVGYCSVGNLHLGDLLFYLPSIRNNIYTRYHHWEQSQR